MNQRIAITGGIGSGKSSALYIIQELGYKTLSSDKIVADLYKTRKVKKLLKSLFPTAVNGKLKLNIDKIELSRLAFSSQKNHEKLTNAITPLVMEKITKLTKNQKGLIFVEVPLLFECNYQNEFDKVMVITRKKDARIASVKTRSNLSEQQILERITAQVDYDKLDLSPYIVIENDGDKDSLKTKIIEKIKEL